MPGSLPQPDTALALVCFCDECNHPVGRWLRPGFRHVFVVVWSISGGGWVAIEEDHELGPRAWAAGTPVGLVGTLRAQGWRVLRYQRSQIAPRPRQPFVLNTCVATAKHWLNIRAPLVITPRQLYRHLMEIGAEEAI